MKTYMVTVWVERPRVMLISAESEDRVREMALDSMQDDGETVVRVDMTEDLKGTRFDPERRTGQGG